MGLVLLGPVFLLLSLSYWFSLSNCSLIQTL
ncbi:hypothetical protein T03_15869 [Trichinella britovi]|uniref:Uncharacterized protein n=1 Tax=Trichinella britovi TaxID=45882 RepID=A0A0V0Z1M3_TRIBR|nr:hypothetical protein T03_15869 [Trichinella britovi]